MERQNMGSDSDAPLPALAYSELVVGKVIGRGGFSVVSEIREIHLQEIYDTGNEEAKLRAELAESCDVEESPRPRYVLKTLRTDLPDDEHTKGIVDLAVEARFLATLTHPNIIAMRGTANSDPLESNFFVILDRLVTTLELKMKHWRRDVSQSIGVWCGPCLGYCCAKKHALHRLWMERLCVARDIASAVRYLHNQDIVYRDLKPDNVGFDEDGDVKLFDFGLAKRLHPDDKTEDDLYMLTGNTGSLRYMAPEVATGQPYDTRVDAYSFGVLFWQICALATPYSGYSCKMHAELVVGKGYRPKPDPSWPSTWCQLMKDSWASDIDTRPDFEHIVFVLDAEISEMLRDDGVVPSRTAEIRAKRKKSFRVVPKKEDGRRLDVDTRLSTEADVTTAMRPDASIV